MKQEIPINSSEFQPKADFVLVKAKALDTGEKTLESGLIIKIERSSMERPTLGEVIEIGEKVEDIKVGTLVMWPQTDGLDIQFEDGDFVLLRYESIIGMKK